MLRLVDICKTYQAGTDTVQALENINLSFRKNEFVSILGPSGSGKTTLLNIVGGLDQYTSGDLVIAGKSTKEFKDRDWDHYRNLRIGFIFQAYNLIPHQNVLSNVELALTISGVSKAERIERAKQALDKVGLADQYYKKPNQLSGGQCQRVAIARALVNNPEILLADEPTGALDTKTSKQIMDLIREIAKDRLVIMVTHNPDLAKEYSSRIINLKDGHIENDSNPYDPEKEKQEIETLSEEEKNRISKAKMSFGTAFNLSGKNLLSKLKRTVLVAIASSIGIIGISSVLSVSFGVTGYVGGMQNDMLSSYPVTIAEEAVDYSSLISGLSSDDSKVIKEFDITTKVGMDSMIAYLMDKYTDITNVKTNDINQNLINYIDEIDPEYLASINKDYGIDVTNNVFTNWQKDKQGSVKQTISLNGLTQKYIASLKTVEGFSKYASYVDLFTNFMKQVPGDEDYITGQYDLLGNSTYPKGTNEIMLVVDKDTTLTDLCLAQMGFYDQTSFINIAKKAITVNDLKKKYSNKEITKEQYEQGLADADHKYPYDTEFAYTDLIGREFYYFPHSALWDYGEVSRESYTQTSVMGLQMIGPGTFFPSVMLSYDEENDALTGLYLSTGSGYGMLSLTIHEAPEEEHSEPLAGTWFNSARSSKVVISNDGTSVTYYPNASSETGKVTLIGQVSRTPAEKIAQGFNYQANITDEMKANPENFGGMKMKVSAILRAKEETKFGSLSRGVYYTKDFNDLYLTDAINENSKIINDPTKGFKAFLNNTKTRNTAFEAYVKFSYTDFSTDPDNGVERNDGYASALNGDLSSSLSSLFSNFTGGINYFETNQVHYRSLCGYKAIENEDKTMSYEMNPQKIEIYPKDFSAKDHVTKYLDRWNSQDDITLKTGDVIKRSDRKDITYTDTVAMIIAVINTLIRIVTVALVAFTSLSLVVSCFMIAVITYISVVERVKEIGVIRSLGGRKKDVARLFTAENLITGLASGVFGVAITYILSIALNGIIKIFGIPAIAALPWWVALIMIGLAILLNVISGLIPSRNASKQDPVNALRSE